MTDGGKRFHFTARVSWVGGREGMLQAPGLPTIAVSAPPEFRGRGDTWTPEHLCVSAAASCYMTTFAAVAESSRLEFKSLTVDAEGKLEKTASGYELTEIVLKPALTVRSVNDIDRAGRLLEKAKKHCIVSNAMRTPVRIETRVYHEQTPACPCPTIEPSSPEVELSGG